MAAGWECPRCSLVLAPHVAEHRCDPPSAGVTTVVPQVPSPWQGVVHPFAPTTALVSPGTMNATTGHLGVAGGYITEVA